MRKTYTIPSLGDHSFMGVTQAGQLYDGQEEWQGKAGNYGWNQAGQLYDGQGV